MAEYIEREAVVMGILGLTIVDPMVAQYADAVLHQIQQVPAVDVAPVVRCKDCLWFMAEYGCPLSESGYFKSGKPLPHENDFCSYGERKDGGG